MQIISREFSFSAGHRLLGHEGKCINPHGHNYRVRVFATADKLDSLGRVVDFGVLKGKLGTWIDKNWDHRFLVYSKDVEMIKALSSISGTKKPYICEFNTTAEHLADYLLSSVCPSLFIDDGIWITAVEVQETDNCTARAELSFTK